MRDRNKDIGLRIKNIRQKKKITQKQLADALNVSQTAIALWESGQRGVSLELIDDLAELLSVSAGYLLFGDVDVDDKDELEHPLAGLNVAPEEVTERDNSKTLSDSINIPQLTSKLYSQLFAGSNAILEEILEETLKKEQLEEFNRKVRERLPSDFGMPNNNSVRFDRTEYTEDELKEIQNFAEFVKSKRKDNE